MMPRFVYIGLVALAFVNPAFASEDEDPFIFGDEVPADVAETDSVVVPAESVSWHEESAPALRSTPAVEGDFAPPSSELTPPAQELPDLPELPPYPQSPAVENVPAPQPQISKEQTLTETLKQDPEVANPVLPSKVEDSWVGKLATKNPLSLISGDKDSGASASLEKMVDTARTNQNANRRSNASVFDISGVMLRMSLKQVDRVMQNRGFRKIVQKYQIPNFIKWRNEEFCRNTGVVGYERIESCVTQKAKKESHQYVQTAKYAKYDTKEEMEVTFSSNFTDNKVIKIVYRSQAANVTGNSPKATYLRNIKVYDFWKKINQKYGKPDDKENVTWGIGGNKPFLKAATGYLKLEDPMLRELDYTRMSREDQRYMNTDLYSF